MNNIEKRDFLKADETTVYESIYRYIKNTKTPISYSNAHLNDLVRGYRKNPTYIPGHLSFIQDITRGLCICQYWDRKEATIHFRDPVEFFNSVLLEKESEPQSYEDLLSIMPFDMGRILTSTMSLIPVPEDFKKIYSSDPIFNIIYPRTKIEMTQLAMADDIYKFNLLLAKDFSIYKAFRRFFIQSMQKLKQYNIDIKKMNLKNVDIPEYLSEDKIWEDAKAEYRKLKNERYDNLVDTFFRHDLKGYKGDSKFENMIDDALHTYYASHANYFITNDNNCNYKAKKTYERLSISTTVLTADEFSLKIALGEL